MSNEVAGLGMAFLSAVVIRGMRTPFFGFIPVASTSNKAELSGGEPVALIPKFWALVGLVSPRSAAIIVAAIFPFVFIIMFFIIF
jgi:hypothetical protein